MNQFVCQNEAILKTFSDLILAFFSLQSYASCSLLVELKIFEQKFKMDLCLVTKDTIIYKQFVAKRIFILNF